MKLLRFNFFVFLIALTAAFSCSTDDAEEYCSSTIVSNITEVTGAETTTVGVPITFKVKFNTLNDCAQGYRFIETTAYPKEISAAVFYEGCSCTPTTSAMIRDYVFKSSATGTFELKFLSVNNTFITKTVTVTP
jgi:hypothetical protein